MDKVLEKCILETGAWLFSLTGKEKASIFDRKFWIGQVMDWCMKDEAFKVEMFRFVDVFPYLTAPSSIARHLKEYFCRPEQNFPLVVQWGIRALSPLSAPARAVAALISRNIIGMAQQFIAGESPEATLPVLNKLRKRGMAFTVDLLGEAVVSDQEAHHYCRRYLDLLETLAGAQSSWPVLGNASSELDWGFAPRINISIKTSALHSQLNARAFEYSVEAAGERLAPIMRKAVEMSAFVNLDMEDRSLKNLTLALYRRILEEPEFRGYPHTGIVIQSYLRDSLEDTRGLIDWAVKAGQPVTIRLVKGSYWDSEVILARQNNWPLPVFERKSETDANYEKLAGIILENQRYVSLACASHNLRSITFTLEKARQMKIPDNRIEYQLLYGMAEPVRNALLKSGLSLRLYVPVGKMIPGMAYLVRRLLENTSNESFLRQRFAEGRQVEDLLRNPLEQGPESVESAVTGQAPPQIMPAFSNFPRLDWTLSENRSAFAAALEKTAARLPIKVPLYIGGHEITCGNRILSLNPNEASQVVGEVSSADMALADKAVDAAREAFPGWRDTSPQARANYLLRAAAEARRTRFELAALQVYEVGKTWDEADADVCEAVDFLEYYAREMIRLAQPQRMGRAPGEESVLFYEPRGVAVVIAPWNFPLAISMGMTSAALVCGNCAVFKPSSESPVIGSMVQRLFAEAGLPPGVLNFLPGAGAAVGDFLVSHRDVALIAFTGSREIGLRIVELASRTPAGAEGVKRVVAEMGGKNAIIIDEDADLDEAVVHLLRSAFSYQGQKCSACSRLIVLDEIYDRLVRRLKAAAESLLLGNPRDPKNFMGAVISSRAKDKIMEYIEIGKKEGRVLVEKPFPGDTGFCVPLTVFTGIRPAHVVAREEIFGPVLSVIRVGNFDEALQVANGTEYALTGGLFSRSPVNIARARREFRVGNLYINRGCTGAQVERHPFGGFRMSGVGSKSGGPDYLLQFMVPRNIVENTMRRGFAPPVS